MFTINKVEYSTYLDEDEQCDQQCGEVFLTTKGNIVFHCTLCESKYKGYDDYAAHVIANHTTTFDPWVEASNIGCDELEDTKELQAQQNIFQHEALEECEISMVDFKKRAYEMRLFDVGQKNPDLDSKNLKRKAANIAKTAETKMFTKPKIDVHMRSFAQSKNVSTIAHPVNHKRYSNQRDFKCSTCDKRFCDIKQLREHLTSKLHMQNLNYNTLPCEKSRQSSSENSVASISVRTEAKSNIAAVEKNDTINLQQQVNRPLQKRELAKHISLEDRKYKCPICGYASNDRSNLKGHVLRHTAEKKIPCPECPKLFMTRSEVKIHMRSHTRERPFLCSECGSKYPTNARLVDHMKRHTNQRDYKCSECGKCFFDNKLLKDHMASHSSERAFACNICPSTFLLKKALRNHLKLHANKREYKCELCEAAFNQQAGLLSHMKTTHKTV